MIKTYLASKDETIRAYKSLAEVSPACTETTSTVDIFQAMAAPSRLACTITNSSIYPASAGTLTINKTGASTGTATFVDTNGRVSTGVFPWSGWQSPGYSNPNLLVNWDFRHPVNQRGQTEYTNVGYCIDMWYLDKSRDYEIEFIVNNGYVSVKSLGERIWFCQKFEQDLKENEIYTASVAHKNGEIKSAQLDTSDNYTELGLGLAASARMQNTFELTTSDGSFADILAAKLEVGTVSTLALDLMQPSNYAEQLNNCQRYLQIYNTPLMAYAHSEWYASTHFKLNQEMRVQPTFNFVGDLIIEDTMGDTEAAFSNLELYSGNTTYPLLRFRTTNGKLSKGANYVVYNIILLFSAEL